MAFPAKKMEPTFASFYFQDGICQHSLQVPISQAAGEDVLIWKPNNKGIWTAQSAYKLLHQDNIHKTVSKLNMSPQTMSVINNIWSKKNILPRVQMFIWRLLSKNIANAQRLHRRINNITQNCSRCSKVENDEHIFFHCSFARAVWLLPLLLLNQTTLLALVLSLSIISYYLQSEEDQDLMYYILWFIWKARNLHRFQNKETSALSVVFQAKAAQKAQTKLLLLKVSLPLLLSLPSVKYKSPLALLHAVSANQMPLMFQVKNQVLESI